MKLANLPKPTIALAVCAAATQLEPGPYKVLMQLALRVNSENFLVWPSLKTIAEDSRCSVSYARKCLDVLIEIGCICKRPQFDSGSGRQTSNAYEIMIDANCVLGGFGPARAIADKGGAPIVAGGGDTPVAGGGAPIVAGGVPLCGHPMNLSHKNQSQKEEDTPFVPQGGKNLFGEPDDLPEVDPDEQLIEQVLERWNALHAQHKGIAAVEVLSPARRVKLLARSNEVAKATGLTRAQVWDRVFAAMERSRFLRGEAPPSAGYTQSHRTTLDFVLSASKFTKIFEGGYDGKQSASYDERLGRDIGPVERADREIAAKLHDAEKRAHRRREDQGQYFRLPPPADPR